MKTLGTAKHVIRVSRRGVVAGLLAAPALVAGLRRAAAAEPVAAGIVNTLSDVGFFVADAKGYFADEGLDVKLTSFRAAGAMMAPLGSGELDVGAGSVTAGIFNANERAIPIRIVADKGRNAPDQSYQSILLRSALADRVKTSADFKGLRVAIPTIGSIGEQAVFNELMKAGGLTYADCEKVFIGIADQVPAFKNGAIDATVLSEPLASVTVSQGTTIRFAPVGKVYPFQQAAVVYYGAPFATKRPDGRRDHRGHHASFAHQGRRPDPRLGGGRHRDRWSGQRRRPRKGSHLRQIARARPPSGDGRRHSRPLLRQGGGGRARALQGA